MATTSTTTKTTKSRAAKAVESAAAKADSSIRSFSQKAEAALHEGVDVVREKGAVYVDEAGRYIGEAQTVVREKVREHPTTSVLAAAGFGLIIGLLIGSGRR